jgi:hypothetical protein
LNASIIFLLYISIFDGNIGVGAKVGADKSFARIITSSFLPDGDDDVDAIGVDVDVGVGTYVGTVIGCGIGVDTGAVVGACAGNGS